MRSNLIAGLSLASMGLIPSVASKATTPARKKHKPAKPKHQDHAAMPEGGWPESRQVRRARERYGK
jgi:hypothetical protein